VFPKRKEAALVKNKNTYNSYSTSVGVFI